MTPETTWVLLRAGGLVALVALTLAVATGLAGPAVTRPTLRVAMVTLHRASAGTALGLVLAHVVLAVVDPWVSVPALAAVVPGASGWEPLWTAVGTVAFDALVVVSVTSALRTRGPRVWWSVHAVTYPAWLLATAHAIAVGTDVGTPAFLVAACVGLLLVGAALMARVGAHRSGAPIGLPPRTGVAR